MYSEKERERVRVHPPRAIEVIIEESTLIRQRPSSLRRDFGGGEGRGTSISRRKIAVDWRHLREPVAAQSGPGSQQVSGEGGEFGVKRNGPNLF